MSFLILYNIYFSQIASTYFVCKRSDGRVFFSFQVDFYGELLLKTDMLDVNSNHSSNEPSITLYRLTARKLCKQKKN